MAGADVDIDSELREALNELRISLTASASALEKAQAIQNRAGQAGFRRVADQIGQVRHRLSQAMALQSTVTSSVESTLSPAGSADDETSPAKVIAALHPAATEISSSTRTTDQLTRSIDNLKAQVAAALDGGQPGPLVALLDAIQHALVKTRTRLATAGRHLERRLADARLLGNLDGVGSQSSPDLALATKDGFATERSSEPAWTDSERIVAAFQRIGSKSGGRSDIRVLETEEEIREAFRQLSAGGTRVPPNPTYNAEEMVVFPDKTTVALRRTSLSGGITIDIMTRNPRNERKIHLPWK